MPKASGTYVYCLVAADRKPPLRGVPAGLPRTGGVRLIEVDQNGSGTSLARSRKSASRQWLAVTDVPLDTYSEEAINRGLSDLEWVGRLAIAHEAVVEFFIGSATLLPMKLFTIFESDDRALDDITKRRERIAVLTDRVANHQEWGVRVALERQDESRRKGRRAGRRDLSGSGYLAQKKAQRDETKERTTRARAVVADLYDDLAGRASEAKRRSASDLPSSGVSLLLDAAFLVPRAKAARFRAALARQARQLAPEGYRVSLTGPWPPYTFMQE